MLRSQFDDIIKQINDSQPDLSDIIFTSRKSIQAEVHGRLTLVRTRPELGVLVPFQVEAMAMVMMRNNLRVKDLIQNGETGERRFTTLSPRAAPMA